MVKSRYGHVSKAIKAPLGFVYDWCTDYRENDWDIFGGNTREKILLKNKHRVVYVQNYKKQGEPKSVVEVVTLHPPKAWHLDSIGDDSGEVCDYTLTSLGPQKTRLELKYRVDYNVGKAPTEAQIVALTHRVWDKFIPLLERDYARKKRQRSPGAAV